MINTFIFDLDGVIVNTAKYHYLAWKNQADSLKIPFSQEENELLKGVGRRNSLDIILELGMKKVSPEKFTELLLQKNDDYLTMIEEMDDSEIFPGVKRTLDFLKENQKKIVLGSASRNARLVIDKIGLSDYFDAIVDGNEVKHTKPHPEVFLKCAEKVNSNSENCVVFEDARSGIQAANTAGMISVGIGNKEVLKEADYVFEKFSEISTEFLERL